MQRAIGMLFRAAGGPPAVRLAPAAEARVGGPRGWLQRVAGTGTHAATGQLEPEVLSLPPVIAVFDDVALNRALYLWLAALAAVTEHTGDWIGDNLRACAAALDMFPGLRERHAQLLQGQLALRPDPVRLKGAAASAEACVQQALRGHGPASPSGVRPVDVAPVWLWLDAVNPPAAPASRSSAADDEGLAAPSAPRAQQDGRRRRSEAVQDERDKAPLMMFFRAESILSWGEFIKVNRASDDDED
ncbi:MAG: hypothetical protein OJI74_12145, partial [Rhodanobacter thiooxydans]|nr:hypothetical protein [Rhodanobacter thiooxydans]